MLKIYLFFVETKQKTTRFISHSLNSMRLLLLHMMFFSFHCRSSCRLFFSLEIFNFFFHALSVFINFRKTPIKSFSNAKKPLNECCYYYIFVAKYQKRRLKQSETHTYTCTAPFHVDNPRAVISERYTYSKKKNKTATQHVINTRINVT